MSCGQFQVRWRTPPGSVSGARITYASFLRWCHSNYVPLHQTHDIPLSVDCEQKLPLLLSIGKKREFCKANIPEAAPFSWRRWAEGKTKGAHCFGTYFLHCNCNPRRLRRFGLRPGTASLHHDVPSSRRYGGWQPPPL